jgi:hypothetical protein
MRLVKCGACGGDVSDEAKVAQNAGKRHRAQKEWHGPIGSGIVIVTGVFLWFLVHIGAQIVKGVQGLDPVVGDSRTTRKRIALRLRQLPGRPRCSGLEAPEKMNDAAHRTPTTGLLFGIDPSDPEIRPRSREGCFIGIDPGDGRGGPNGRSPEYAHDRARGALDAGR